MTCYSPKSRVIRCVTSAGAALHCTAEKHRRSGEAITNMGSWDCWMLLLLALPSAFSMSYLEQGSLLYPYGEAHNDEVTETEDDGGTDCIPLSHPFCFFQTNYSCLYVNNNGAISFKQPVTEYTPDAFPIPDLYMIVPYWGDVDNERGGSIYYRQTTDEKLMNRLFDDIHKMVDIDKEFKPDWAFIATWHKVAYHGTESSKTNTFQAILTSDGSTSIVIFIYHDICWTTGTASGGDPKTGLGGIPAQAGFNTANKHFSIPFSRTEHIKNIQSSSNVDIPGCWVFRVDDFKAPGGCTYSESFLKFGQTMWSDEACTTQCSCRRSGKVLCEDKKCNEGLVCVPSGKHYTCQIDEEDC
ncbi:alpha-tectorin-like [Dendrobates tinctorius]|uniref:alpha-tectorin-like n=1 Tax=Dendrobates tinctorius TaxID=92724 RepID=UPI003CC9D2B3